MGFYFLRKFGSLLYYEKLSIWYLIGFGSGLFGFRISGFRGQRFQPHSNIFKFQFRFASDFCGFRSSSDNPFKLLLKF